MADEKDRKQEGAFEKLGGKVKEGIGKAIGHERLTAEGKAQSARGTERVENAKAEGREKGKLEELEGKVKNRFGALVGDDVKQSEGKAEQLKGEQRRAENRPSAPSTP